MITEKDRKQPDEVKQAIDPKLIARYIIRETMGLVIMAVALFWSTDRIGWWQGWAVLAVMFAWIAATAIIILCYNPDLLKERLGPRQGAKRWDTAILSVVGLIQLGRYIVAGLDQRNGSTAGFPLALQIVALVVCILGYALVVWATYANTFFSQIVRIQSERGHAVVTGGPYRLVRHPGYLGAILFELAVPVLLTSWWALLLSGLSAGLLVLRTVLEDRTLLMELAGYQDYARRVQQRLVPGVW